MSINLTELPSIPRSWWTGLKSWLTTNLNAIVANLNTAVQSSELGVTVATLEDGKIPVNQLPNISITNIITSSQTTLAAYISEEWESGAIQIGDIIQVTTADDSIELWMLYQNDGDEVTDYKRIEASKVDWENILNKPNLISVNDENAIVGENSNVLAGIRNFVIGDNSIAQGEGCTTGGKIFMNSEYNISVVDNNTVDIVGTNVTAYFETGKPFYVLSYDIEPMSEIFNLVSVTYTGGNTRLVKSGGRGFEDDYSGFIYLIVGNVSQGNYGSAEGLFCHSIGGNSHAEGYNTVASGNHSHAEGNNTVASGNQSHAEGDSTMASGNQSHAEGNTTVASGTESHAEGDSTIASGGVSHAEGSNTIAYGIASHAEGYNSKALRDYQHSRASGRFSEIGDAQMGSLVMRRQTTSDTPSQLFIDGSSQKFKLEDSKCYTMRIMVVAKNVTDSYSASWIIEGRIDNIGATPVWEEIRNVFSETTDSTFEVNNVAVSVVTGSPDELKIGVTGQASRTIRWVGYLDWVEVF